MEQEENQVVDKKEPKKNYLVPILIAVVVLLAISTAYLGWQYKQLSDDKKQLQSQIDNLNKQLTSVKESVKTSANPTPTPTTKVVISKALLENVPAAINTMNTAALEGYMAPTVNVILAASEGIGPQTPVQAVKALDYLNSATEPWNFNLPSSTLSIYKNNQYYGKYFGNNTIVGKSANGYVVAFGVNSSGKIDTIFMAVSEDLLTQ